MKQQNGWKEYGIVTIGTLIVAAAVYFFLIPSQVVVGSLSGLVMVIAHFIPVKISVLTMIFNVGLLILGFCLIGKEFGAKTVYSSVIMPVFLYCFEILVPGNPSLTNDSLLDLLCYLLVVSLGLAMLFNVNASSGGLDIVVKLLNKYFHLELGKAMTVAGMLIAVSSVLIYDTRTLILSILATYANGIILDHFIDGFNRRKRICILSEEYEKIQKFIVEDLNRGVTMYPAIGGYRNEKKLELVTILTRNEYAALLQYLHSVDQKAFVTVSTVNEVIGAWNMNRK